MKYAQVTLDPKCVKGPCMKGYAALCTCAPTPGSNDPEYFSHLGDQPIGQAKISA